MSEILNSYGPFRNKIKESVNGVPFQRPKNYKECKDCHLPLKCAEETLVQNPESFVMGMRCRNVTVHKNGKSIVHLQKHTIPEIFWREKDTPRFHKGPQFEMTVCHGNTPSFNTRLNEKLDGIRIPNTEQIIYSVEKQLARLLEDPNDTPKRYRDWEEKENKVPPIKRFRRSLQKRLDGKL